MRKTNTKRHALFTSVISLLLCVSMLMGTTFAWFTDSVKSGINTIAAGVLDVELYHSNAAVTEQKVDSSTQLFMDLQGDPILWEPGVVSYENLRIANEGDLALAYQLTLNTANENYILDPSGAQYGLSQILKVGVVPGGITATDRAGVVASVADTDWTTLANFLRSGSLLPEDGKTQETWGVVVYWQPGETDNYWNLNNGKQLSSGEMLQIDLGVKLVATQESYESDSFGTDFDAEAKPAVFPNFVGGSASATVIPNEQNQTSADVTLSAGAVAATVPAGVQLADGTTELQLNVSMMGASGSNITLGENEDMRSLDVHIAGVAANNTTPITVTLKEAAPMGLNLGNYKVYHVEESGTKEMTLVAAEDAFTAHNQFKYDPATGDVTLYMATFSEVAVVADTENAWEGKFDYSWYNADEKELTIANADQLAGFGAIVGGMNGKDRDSFENQTVKLISDINLGDGEKAENNNNVAKIFYPIGYYNSKKSYDKVSGGSVTSSVSSFKGTFDGNGHTVSNFYQNTWEMFGDYNDGYSGTPNHYKDAMGLFGYVNGGTVKNLAVSNFSSDGEYTPTGVIAAYAAGNATFENIAITNCTPRVYNTGNGGIIGIAGDTSAANDDHITLTNITVDNSNKITALWGSYDVACGGLVGMYRGNVDGSGNATGDTISFKNCHVSAQMDVYNDVCANYQYYAYRYTGMIIGSVRHNTTSEGKTIPNMTGISATGCTVHFGTWNDYYYCEFEKNGHPSYSGPDDYKFSRIPHSEINFTDSNGNGIIDTEDEKASVTGCKHNHTAAEDQQCVYLEFNNLFTGYGWGVSSKGLTDFAGVENMGISQGDHENSVEKFKGKVTELANNKEYKLGEIFSFVDKGVKLVPSALAVAVNNLDENNPVSVAEFNRDNENWENGTLKLTGTGKVQITIQDYYFCTPTTITVNVTARQAEEKFDIVMNNGDFLHRVGNDGNVPLDKLFKAKDGVTVGTVSVTVEAVNGTGASGTYSNDAIQFSGTGVVKVTIKDDDQYCTPTVLFLEVANATNITTKTDAKDKNLVLLNNISGGFKVSDGYSFYGNGFTVTCSGDGSYRSAAVSYGYVTVENGGTLDHVRIICDIFPESYAYTNEMVAGPDGRYPYGYSAVVVNDNSTISNCYIEGARNNIQVGEGNVTIKNTTTKCGSLSNIHIKSTDAYTVTLHNVTTEQVIAESKYNTNKKVYGFGILVGTNESVSNAKLKLTGRLTQNNWIAKSDANTVSNSYAKTAIANAFDHTEYVNNGKINTGIVYLNSLDAQIADERDKDSVEYALKTIRMSGYEGKVYSIISGTPGTGDSVEGNEDILPTVVFTGTEQNAICAPELVNGTWTSKLTVDLDKIAGGTYKFSFNDLKVQKYGVNLNYTVKDVTGNDVNKNNEITLNQLSSAEYTLVVTDNQIYDRNGKLTETSITRELPFVLSATKTSIEPPKFTNAGTATAIRLVDKKGGDWRPAYTVLTGVTVTYWSASESKVKTVDLSTLYNSGTSSSNAWTYTCNDYTLTITGGQVHSDGSKITPVVSNNTLYFASTNKAFTTGTTSRSIILTYVFTDKNDSTTWNRTETATYSNLSEYDYSKFKNGTLEEPSSGGSCVTPDTLITLADGTQKRVDQLTGNELLLVWNLETGKYEAAPIVFVDSEAESEYEIIHLYFSDGSDVKVISEHGFFDLTLGKYVYIDADNYTQYLDHQFVTAGNVAAKTWKIVTLDDVVIEKEVTTAWSPVTFQHLCYYTNGVLSMPGGIEGLFNIFDVDLATMRYDAKKKAADIKTYGLFTLEDFGGMIPEIAFEAFNGAYLKVAMGKGLLTWEDIAYMAERYIPLMK